MTAIIRTIERTEWQQLAPSFSDYNYRQLWDFGIACAKRLNAISDHVAIQQDQEIIGLADVRIKHIPVIGGGIGYVNGGPMVRRNTDGQWEVERLRTVLAGLVDYYVKKKKFVLRIQPPLGPDYWNGILGKTFLDMGCSSHRQSHRTIVLDLSPSLELIRKRFKQKWRNCLNSAEKKDLTVKTGTDEMFFSTFVHLYQEMRGRKDFSVDLSPEFYGQVQKNLTDNEQFLVSIVYKNDQPVAGHVSSILGDTCVYLLGATIAEGLKNKAAYIAQWSVIQTAKEEGCQFYDLGGIDPDKNPGVYHFKKGMGGEEVTAPGSFEFYPSGLRQILVGGCEKVYTILRILRRH